MVLHFAALIQVFAGDHHSSLCLIDSNVTMELNRNSLSRAYYSGTIISVSTSHVMDTHLHHILQHVKYEFLRVLLSCTSSR